MLDNANSLDRPEGWSAVPGFFKGLIVLQSFTIVFLGYWLYQEFRNNVFLQLYLRNIGIDGNVIIITFLGLFLLGIATVYSRIRRPSEELDEILLEGRRLKDANEDPSPSFEEDLLDRLRERNRQYRVSRP